MLRRSKVIGTLSISTLICWIMKFTLYSTKGNDIYTIYTAVREMWSDKISVWLHMNAYQKLPSSSYQLFLIA